MQVDHHRRVRSAGFTMAEMLMAIIVFTVAAVVMGNHITVNYSVTKLQRERVFAFAKAQAILSEIHSFVDTGQIEAAVDLDVLDDGASFDPVLTISDDGQGSPLPADHPLSGNTLRGPGDWAWSRRISVRPFAGRENRTVRYVTVRVFRTDQAGVERELASLSSVINSIGGVYPPTQAFDVYLLAMENVPGWWVYMDSIIPFVESAITDLENRNPGLEIRSHWITKLAYGRNRTYRPHVNLENDSLQPVNDVYWYPGKMPDGESSNYYYVPDLIKARVQIDADEVNSWDGVTNPYPYALADHFNHAMRYPRAKALHDLRVSEVQQRRQAIADAEANGLLAPAELNDMSDEPTWQVLLEEMSSNPDQYRNALILNLHGELLPMPPFRNYSDAAKDPVDVPYVRVVTHPEEIRTRRPFVAGDPALLPGEDTSVGLRVYAYTNDPSYLTAPSPELWSGEHLMPDDRPIAIQIMDLDLTDGSGDLDVNFATVERIEGGIKGGASRSGASVPYSRGVAPVTESVTDEMYYESRFVHNPGERAYTLLLLYNTPVTAPIVAGAGLAGNSASDRTRARLYGMDYQPGCVGGTDFTSSTDLTSTATGPKNTARWLIRVSDQVFVRERFVPPTATSPADYFNPNTLPDARDQVITVRTKIWDPDPLPADPLLPVGTEVGLWREGPEDGFGDPPPVRQPDNFSETYTWWAATREAVPVTERSQFQGDPRHNPYEDLLALNPDYPDGYNWWFDSLRNNGEDALADYPGIAEANNQWHGVLQIDVPRYMEVLRSALIGAESIWTTLTGYSYYYLGVGNEIGYDSANGYPNSIPVSRNPWGDGATSTGFINNITVRSRWVVQASDRSWHSMPWLGELYQDSSYASDYGAPDLLTGLPRGNLSASSTAFQRRSRTSVYAETGHQRAFATDDVGPIQRPAQRGSVTFFNNGTSSNHFNHHFRGGQNGTLVGPGLELDSNYGLDLPDSTEINRPFSLLSSGNTPSHYDIPPYSTTRTNATLLRTYYNHEAGEIGSGLVQMENTAGTSAAHIVVNGIAQTTTTGAAVIGRFCLLSMFQSYFELGDPAQLHRIAQSARLEVFSPTEISEITNPAIINVEFRTDWQRWDSQVYAGSLPSGFAENELDLEYLPMYSSDGGNTWRHMQDNSVATPGSFPSNPLVLVPDSGVGDESYPWSVPAAQFPEGSYLVRVECYRRGQALHYSHHQVRIYIER